MSDEDWFSVTVRIYLEGWQNLDPTLESAVKIESNSLTAAQIASDGDTEKVYIASDDLKVYTHDGTQWQGAEADPNKVYVISNSFYSYSKGGLNEISPADRGSHYVEVNDFVEDADIAGMVGMADGDAYLASDTMKLYVYSEEDGDWAARDLEMNEVVVNAADGKVYAKQAGEFKARVGGNIWDDKEYVGASFNVGMTFAVDAY
jgi:DNA-binding beta-propeller fold protein YncE